jgi:hypothetical protein
MHQRHAVPHRLARHGECNIGTASAGREHAKRAGGGRMAVRADGHSAGLPETGHVHRVTDAVAGLAEPHAEAPAGAA